MTRTPGRLYLLADAVTTLFEVVLYLASVLGPVLLVWRVRGTVIPPGEVWAGAPARRVSAETPAP